MDHFFGSGLLSAAPLDAIIRRNALEAIGGFPTPRTTSDMQCWLTLARKHPVVVLNAGLTWWRRHEQQEYTLAVAQPVKEVEVSARHLRNALDALSASDCPLPQATARRAAAMRLAGYGGRALGALRGRRLAQSKAYARESGRSLTSLLWNGLFNPRPLRPQFAPKRPPAQPNTPPTSPPRVSVLMPVRDCERHLTEAIESVQAQTLAD